MKKLPLFCTLYFVFCIWTTFGYTAEDASNANYLSDQGVVTKQTVASRYRLDDKILRQEVIGMALKIKWITLPENYTCKKYFADATKNDWVCRAVELAADNGIISRNNTYANPGKSITRAEALAMVVKAGGIQYTQNVKSTGYKTSTPQWQIDLLEGAIVNWVINTSVNFWINEEAFRKTVFEFAKKTKISTFDKVYSDEVISFKYPSEYYDIYANKIQKTLIKEENNSIMIWSGDGVFDNFITVKYYKNIYSDSDVLKTLGYTESEDCKNPDIWDKKIFSSWAVTFNPFFWERMGICSVYQKWLHFPQQWILITISQGQDINEMQVLDASKRFNANDVLYNKDFHPYMAKRLQKFYESFRIVTE